MKTINLEQELLLSNKKENEDSLILNEAKDILGKAADDDVALLSQMGLDHAIKKYDEINRKNFNLYSIIENLDKNRVFTTEQIKNVANKYVKSLKDNVLGYVKLESDTMLNHHEHLNVLIKEGSYEIRQCRSWEANPVGIWSLRID